MRPAEEHEFGRRAADGEAPRVSVVVTTCNRASKLHQLFDALRNQTINGKISWEFILVDNGSIDDTAKVSHELASALDIPVTYAFEPTKGKSRGLNTGVSLARGTIIAFTDDDGVPARDWLEALLQHFDEHPEVACVGGRVELYDPADALITVRLSRERQVVDAATFSVSNTPVIGCNLAVQAAALRAIGQYDTDVGPGSRVGSGDDVDMMYRLVRAGSRIGYDPRPLVLHNHGRRTDQQVKGVRDRYVIGRGAFYCKYMMQADQRVTRWARWEVAGLLKEWLRAGVVTKSARGSMRTVALLGTGALRYIRQRLLRGHGAAA